MRTLSKKQRIGLIVAAVIVGVYTVHHFSSSAQSQKQAPIAVTTSHVVQQDVTLSTHAIGNVQPYVTVSVKSRVDGQLLSIGFKEGDVVKEGQVIFQIDAQPFQVALQQAQANLARDQAQLDNYNKTLERYIPLVKKGYVSKQEYDQAVANAKAQEATVLSDKAAVSNAELNVSYCTIRAPISGRTGNLLVNSGNLVKVTDANALVVINQVSPVYISFSLPEQQLSSIQQAIKKGTLAVNLQLKNQTTALKGRVSFMDNAVDSTTGMIKLKAIFDNQHEELWPGEYVDVTLPYTQLSKALLVPTQAIQANPDGAYVFIVGKESKVQLKSIKTTAALDDQTIVEGLAAGDEVVMTGQAQLIDGSLVETTKVGA